MTLGESENHYDVIVIGGGLGGLTVAAWLAKAGMKVLLIEKEVRVGGLFGPYMYGSHYFNNGPRLLMGCNADGLFGPGLTSSFLKKTQCASKA
jgi:prolycopene isomerase